MGGSNPSEYITQKKTTLKIILYITHHNGPHVTKIRIHMCTDVKKQSTCITISYLTIYNNNYVQYNAYPVYNVYIIPPCIYIMTHMYDNVSM